MIYAQNSPGVGTEAVESSGENTSILPEFAPHSPELNPFAFKLLPALLSNSPDPLYEARLVGFSEAWDAQQTEVNRVSEIADFWYLRANNTPAQIKEIQQRQIDQNYAAYERRFMAGEAT